MPIISIAPIRYFDISTTDNLIKIKKYIRMAKRAGSDIICFPESCIKKNGCIQLKGKLINAIQEECKKNSIWCIVTEDLLINKKPFNVSILINRKGKITGKYRKINLYGDKVNPGNKVEVFKTDFGKIGVVICWDLASPDLFQTMREKGAEIIFCPSQWWYDSEPHKNKHKKEREMVLLKSLILARAFENVCFVALCNPLVDSKYQVSYSAIASPLKILKESVNDEKLISVEVDRKEIKRLRKFYDNN